MARVKKTQSKSAAPAEAVKPEAEVKAAPVAEEKPVEAKAPAAKKTEKPAAKKAEKPAAKKTEKPAAKKAEKPAAKKSAEAKKDVFEIQGNSGHTIAEITELCKADYKGDSRKHVKSIDIYVKAENGEMRAYYVINGNPELKGSIVL